jgi:predicted DNA-binding protein
MSNYRENRETARKLVNSKGKFYSVMESIEETLEEMGDDYDVEITEEAVDRVRDEFCKKIIESKDDDTEYGAIELENTPDGWVNGLYEDFEQDRGRQAVSFMLGKASEGRDCLTRLSEAMMARKYGNYSR